MKNTLKILCILSMLLVSGCSSRTHQGAIKLSDVRLNDPIDIEVREREILKKDLQRALSNSAATERLRVIEMANSVLGTKNAIPEYRLFDITPGSVYDILGLQNSDILVAADGYVPTFGSQFKEYVKLLNIAENAQVEIKRAGRTVRYRYMFK